jgi:hypothetical protein
VFILFLSSDAVSQKVRGSAFELSRWRGGRYCMGFLRTLLAV